MKKAFLLAAASALVLSVALAPTASAEKFRGKVGGGPTGGTFNTFANAMAVFVPKQLPDVTLSAVGSGGSVENVKRVSNGESEFGLVYAVDASLAWRGELPEDSNEYRGLCMTGFLYGAPAQLVVQEGSDIQRAADLKGKRVAVGNAGSGAAASAERFFRHVGVWDEFRPQFLGYSAAASAFKDGKIDAFWVLVGYPNRSIIEASVQEKIRLIDVHEEAEESGFYEEFAYIPTTIPAGTYGKGMPETHTFQDATLLGVNADVPEDVVYDVMKVLWSEEGMKEITAASKSFDEMNLDNAFLGASVTLHPGAVKFWTEHGKEIPEELQP
ncbi:MAG: TAXI family TRAP transporter solute-binding subunit [Candidatus Krumholzibacteriia bacterium]